MEHLRLLFLDDKQDEIEKICKEIENSGLTLDYKVVNNREDFIDEITYFNPDIILSDYILRNFDGISALMMIVEHFDHIPFIFVSDEIEADLAPCLILNGAADLVPREEPSLLFSAIIKSLRLHNIQNTYDLLIDKLKDSELKQEIAFNKFSDPILWIDEESKTIVNCNDSAEKLFRKDRKEILNTNFSNIFPNKIKECSEILFNIQEKYGEIHNELIDLRIGSEGSKKVLINGTRADYNNNKIFQWVFNDISEEIDYLDMLENNFIESVNIITSGMRDRINDLEMINKSLMKRLSKKESMEKRYKNQISKLKQKNGKLEDNVNFNLLNTISHDLRDPLNGIIGFSQVLEMQKDGELNDTQMEYLHHIKASSLNIVEKINDLIDISKIESGIEKIEKNPFDLKLMFDEIPISVEEFALTKNIEVSVDVNGEIGWLNGDMIRIKRALSNIVSGIINYSQLFKKIVVSATSNKDDLIISIWNDGLEMTGEEIKNIFDDEDDIRNFDNEYNSEISFKIAKKIVKLHGGTIFMERSKKFGDRINIVLPERVVDIKVFEEKTIHDHLNEFDKDDRDLNVLVIEDDIENVRLLEVVFSLTSWRVDYVMSGEKGLELLNYRDYDLILTDICLPGLDGAKIMRKIKDEKSSTIPVIALTAYALQGDKEKFLNMGFDDYISKPIDVVKFVPRLKDSYHKSQKLNGIH